jgi:hypothetical protein
MLRLIRDDLHMRAYRQSKRHLITLALNEIRHTRTECLLQWHAKNEHENILFTDEKIFTIKEQYNCQNDKIYAQTSREAKEKVPRVQRGHHPSYIMVWWGGGGPIRGDISSFMQESCENWYPSVSRGCATRSTEMP